ncbi:MAG: hypothetical protein M3Z04_12480, partial [Chloroflexota bacterium]|nr:hypothetical protein [Chloroflexota bacterium]
MKQRLSRWLCLALPALGLLLIAAPPVGAHNAFPAREFALQAGPYHYRALLFNEKVNAGDHVQILLVPDPIAARPELQIQLQALGPNGATVAATLVPDENDHRSTAADLVIPTQGAWQIGLTVSGPLGSGRAGFPLSVNPAPALPQWAGWAIALSPLLGVAWFAMQQRSLLRNAECGM